MDKKQFIDMVGKPTRFSSQDRGWLRAVQAKYPHSSVIGLLALLADHAYHYDTPAQRRAVTLSVCDPAVIDSMLERAATTAADDPSFDILTEINTYQEVSFKTAPKSVILSNFLQAGPADAVQHASAAESPVALDDKKSLRADESLGTETLAVILEKQGKYDKALAIYRNLLAHNPEKSSNFAPRIEKLESLINNK